MSCLRQKNPMRHGYLPGIALGSECSSEQTVSR